MERLNHEGLVDAFEKAVKAFGEQHRAEEARSEAAAHPDTDSVRPPVTMHGQPASPFVKVKR